MVTNICFVFVVFGIMYLIKGVLDIRIVLKNKAFAIRVLAGLIGELACMKRNPCIQIPLSMNALLKRNGHNVITGDIITY